MKRQGYFLTRDTNYDVLLKKIEALHENHNGDKNESDEDAESK